LLLISHDRAFVDQVVTSTWVFDGHGSVEEYVGGYQDFLVQRAHQQQLKKTAAVATNAANNKTPVSPAPISKKAKLSYKDQRELDGLPDAIAALEAEQATLEAALADGSWFIRDTDGAHAAANRLVDLEQELLDKLERWTVLEAASQGA
jgi:ATP-binding cassette subfamily F protein uup